MLKKMKLGAATNIKLDICLKISVGQLFSSFFSKIFKTTLFSVKVKECSDWFQLRSILPSVDIDFRVGVKFTELFISQWINKTVFTTTENK